MLEQTVVHLIRQHVDATTFSASLIHTPTMQELASVRRFLDGLCSGTNDDSDPAAPLLRLIRRVGNTAEILYRSVGPEWHIPYKQNFYSVPFTRIGQTLPVRVTDSELIV